MADDKLFLKLCVDLFFISCISRYRLLEPDTEDTKIVENVSSYSPNITESHSRRLETSSAHFTLFRKLLRAVRCVSYLS
jgi:hypothetical protein